MSRAEPSELRSPRWHVPAVSLAAVVGLSLMVQSAQSTSATYDEVTYIRTATDWWRTGSQDKITRMGSPLTFWKLQQAPVLWLLDRCGKGTLIDDPIRRQAELLPWLRLGALWVWVVALGLTAGWSRIKYGPRAMAYSAWLFVLSPNLLAHGAIITMELPIVAATVGVFFLFVRFLETREKPAFFASATVCGLAFSCKFSAILLPPLLALIWWVDRSRWGHVRPFQTLLRVVGGMAVFVAVMLAADIVVTGGATLTVAQKPGFAHPSIAGRFGGSSGMGGLLTWIAETPIPQDWVGFANQVRHQRSGGPSYLRGERRMSGWWYYYFVALAVKVPLSLGLLVITRVWLSRRYGNRERDWIFPLTIAAFLLITAAGSSRNYGVRYLLPLSPLAIVWVSALAEQGRRFRFIAILGLLGQAMAVASVHPHELTYFNVLTGGRAGGRRVLADSNLDWGQGLIGLARLQLQRPELTDLTLYYFGDTDPAHYGVSGISYTIDAGSVHPGLPELFEAKTEYAAVSASLQWGPWGSPGYFRRLDGVRPVASTADTTIAIYRSSDIPLN